MYRKNIRSMDRMNEELFEEVYKKIISYTASKDEKESFIKEYLGMVVNMAAKYSANGVNSDELIQEGNLCLLVMTDRLEKNEISLPDGNKSIREKCDELMRDEVRKVMVSYIDNEYKSDSEINTAVAKANLLYDASNYLANELSRVASIKELSEFTHISVSEIEDIIKFSGGKIIVGDGKDTI